MTLYSYTADYTSSFRGDPNASISAINTSGGIVCWRTSGKVPCFIQASASGITATGTSRPYEDLYCEWDFGDPSGTETITNPGTTGGTLNLNSGQKGPEAAYVYRTAGTYTITLTIRGARASGLVLETVTQQITISAFTPAVEYWADSTAGGTNAGTLANPFNTVAAINTALTGVSNLSLHVKRGSAFAGSTSLVLWGSVAADRTGLRIDAYGSGATPSFDISSTSAYPVSMTNGSAGASRAKDDIVISNIKFIASGTSTGGCVNLIGYANATAALTNIYLDNCEIANNADNGDSTGIVCGGYSFNGFGAWNCTVTGTVSPSNKHMGYYLDGDAWVFVVGGSIQGGNTGTSLVREHHIYPDVRYHTLYRAIDFQTGANRNYCINLNWDHDGVSLPEYSEFHLIADCDMAGVQRAFDCGENLNDPAETLFRNIVAERNNFHDLSGDAPILFSCVEQITIRYNNSWACEGGRFFAPDVSKLATILKSKGYGNKFYRSNAAVAGDIYSFPSASWTQLQEWTYNITQDMRSAAQIEAFPFTQQIGATRDRNQYYAPNDSNSKYVRDVTTEKTLAEMQSAGYGANDTYGDPGWTDPANGDFRQAA